MEKTLRRKMAYLRQTVSMKNRLLIIILACWSSLLSFPLQGTELVYFYDRSCPHCSRLSNFLEKRIVSNYQIEVKKFEIHNRDNAAALIRLAKALNAEKVLKYGTPAVFIGRESFQGDTRANMRRIETAVRRAVREKPPSPLTFLPQDDADAIKNLSLAAVLGAAAADSINPCAIAVLILLLGTIMIASKGKRSRILAIGSAFTAACFISYFLMGLGLYSAIQSSAIQHYIYVGVAFMAIILGFWNIKDIFWKDTFSIQVPVAWQPHLKKLTAKIRSVPGAFGIGILISLFLLPCTSGPYIVIIGMLSQTVTRLQAIILLLLYNLIFILPFLIVTGMIGFGLTTTARVEKWRQSKFPLIKGTTGLIMLIIGIALIVMMSTGKL